MTSTREKLLKAARELIELILRVSLRLQRLGCRRRRGNGRRRRRRVIGSDARPRRWRYRDRRADGLLLLRGNRGRSWNGGLPTGSTARSLAMIGGSAARAASISASVVYLDSENRIAP